MPNLPTLAAASSGSDSSASSSDCPCAAGAEGGTPNIDPISSKDRDHIIAAATACPCKEKWQKKRLTQRVISTATDLVKESFEKTKEHVLEVANKEAQVQRSAQKYWRRKVRTLDRLVDRLKRKVARKHRIRGPTGAMGPKGVPGNTGIQGKPGKTGKSGLRGPRGTRGRRGPMGVKGKRGDIGKPGLTGKMGRTGGQGPQGPPGLQGNRGERGDRGKPGPRGKKGSTGRTGRPGAIGRTGPLGPRGRRGRRGPTGPRGRTGLPGRKGRRGRPGLHGYSGRKGASGRTGRPGARGFRGRRGSTGVRGWRGHRGKMGRPGVNGKNGVKGYTGYPGYRGYKGRPGAPGRNGRPGKNGKPGARGRPGRNGRNGKTRIVRRTVRIARFGRSAMNFPKSRKGYLIKNPISGFPSRAISVAFWMRSGESRTAGSPVSYATKQKGDNTFLLYDVRRMSVYMFGKAQGTNVRLVDGRWHHVVVTWESKTGKLVVYKDGKRVYSRSGYNKGQKLPSGGSLVLGQEQDAVGGRFDRNQAFIGQMSDFGMWNRALSSKDVRRIRYGGPQWSRKGLLAAFNFYKGARNVAGSSRYNMRALGGARYRRYGYRGSWWRVRRKIRRRIRRRRLRRKKKGKRRRRRRSRRFRSKRVWGRSSVYFNSKRKAYVMANPYKAFPSKAVSIAFWMRSRSRITAGTPVSYATKGKGDNTFLLYDIRRLSIYIAGRGVGTGINLADGKWHHVVVTWRSRTGRLRVYRDGRLVWSRVHQRGQKLPSGGSLVLGQEQDAVGGRFDKNQAFLGQMADFAVWNRPLGYSAVRRIRYGGPARYRWGLVTSYNFYKGARDLSGKKNNAKFGGGARYMAAGYRGSWYFKGVRAGVAGKASMMFPRAGKGYVKYNPFRGFPIKSVSLAFWMKTRNRSKAGTPFSYATKQKTPNTFLLYDVRRLSIWIANKPAQTNVRLADGRWHHVAVTWKSSTGRLRVYKDGRLAYHKIHQKGVTLADRGSLVLGQEQDSVGGHFDRRQSFIGYMSSMGIWKGELSASSIRRVRSYGPRRFRHGLVAAYSFVRGARDIGRGKNFGSVRGGARNVRWGPRGRYRFGKYCGRRCRWLRAMRKRAWFRKIRWLKRIKSRALYRFHLRRRRLLAWRKKMARIKAWRLKMKKRRCVRRTRFCYYRILKKRPDSAFKSWYNKCMKGMSFVTMRRYFYKKRAVKHRNRVCRFRVRRLYRVLLRRRPDRNGFRYWVAKCKKGMHISKIRLAFKRSREYRRKWRKWRRIRRRRWFARRHRRRLRHKRNA